jgi:UDP-N-acetylglucosamine 2-epimerase (non-hydrolysing)
MTATGGIGSVPVAIVFGTRPEAIKLAPVIHALRKTSVHAVAVSIGQHKDLLQHALPALSLEPDLIMPLGPAGVSSDMSATASQVLFNIGCVLSALRPRLVVVQGDTITAAMTATAALLARVPVAHVEAGLRTFDLADPFPEEGLRRSITTATSVHFAPTQFAADTLYASGVCSRHIHVVGNTIVDALKVL